MCLSNADQWTIFLPKWLLSKSVPPSKLVWKQRMVACGLQIIYLWYPKTIDSVYIAMLASHLLSIDCNNSIYFSVLQRRANVLGRMPVWLICQTLFCQGCSYVAYTKFSHCQSFPLYGIMNWICSVVFLNIYNCVCKTPFANPVTYIAWPFVVSSFPCVTESCHLFLMAIKHPYDMKK